MLGLDLLPLDAMVFDMSAVLADQRQALRIAKQVTRARGGKPQVAEVASAAFLRQIYLEG